MDYTSWESLSDNSSVWKQELSSSLKKGELVLKETSEEKRQENAGKEKSHRRQMYIRLTTLFYLTGLQPPLQVTHRTVQPHQKMLICRLDEESC